MGRHVGVKGVVFGRTRPQKQGPTTRSVWLEQEDGINLIKAGEGNWQRVWQGRGSLGSLWREGLYRMIRRGSSLQWRRWPQEVVTQVTESRGCRAHLGERMWDSPGWGRGCRAHLAEIWSVGGVFWQDTKQSNWSGPNMIAAMCGPYWILQFTNRQKLKNL